MTPNKQFKNQCNIQETIKATCSILETCKKHNLQVWICYGALLGLIREKRLLPWNNDVELMILESKNYHKKIIALAQELSNQKYHCIYHKNLSALSIKTVKEGVNININFAKNYKGYIIRPHEPNGGRDKDINIFSKFFWWIALLINSRSFVSLKNFHKISLKYKSNYLISSLFYLLPISLKEFLSKTFHLISNKIGKRSISTALPVDLILPLKVTEFYGTTQLIPGKPEDLLCYLYGSDWKTPREKWSFYDDRNKNISKMKYLNINLFGVDLDNFD